MPLFSFITIPDASSTLQAAGVWSTSIFNETWPIALIGIGAIIGGLIVSFILYAILRAFGYLLDFHDDGLHLHKKGRSEL